MANLDFYALADDLRDLIRFIFAETDIVIYELGSQFDRELRQFRSLSESKTIGQTKIDVLTLRITPDT